MCHTNHELSRAEVRYRIAIRRQCSIIRHLHHIGKASAKSSQKENNELLRLRDMYCSIMVHMIRTNG